MIKKFLFAISFISIATTISIAGYLFFAKQQPALAAGNIINATSCEQANVQTAIDAAVDGDTVMVPAGSCVWSLTVNIPSHKGISLIGAGEDGSGTKIIDSTLATYRKNAILLDTAMGHSYRISGFSFTTNVANDYQGVVQVIGNGTNWRIDHCKFTDTKSSILITGLNYGVIDSCVFEKNSEMQGLGVQINGINTDASLYWNKGHIFGSGNAVYIENNIFDYDYKNDSAVQGVNGIRYVFRHNTVRNTVVDAHGADSSNRSTVAWEIYNNNFTCDHLNCANYVYLRGGSGVVFNNMISGNWNATTQALLYFRSCFNNMECVAFHTPANPSWGNCDVNTTYNFSRCDGNASIDGNEDSTGYPCKDQPGITAPAFTKAPIYEWNNKLNGNDIDFSINTWLGCINPFAVDHIKINRDFYNNTPRPNYTPYTYPHPLTAATSKKGDFNLDDKVNDLDFTSFKNAFKSIFNSIFDLNSDNAIDVKDLGVLMSGWLE